MNVYLNITKLFHVHKTDLSDGISRCKDKDVYKVLNKFMEELVIKYMKAQFLSKNKYKDIVPINEQIFC